MVLIFFVCFFFPFVNNVTESYDEVGKKFGKYSFFVVGVFCLFLFYFNFHICNFHSRRTAD